MRSEALFLNGVYKSILEEILAVQAELPEQIMFLQPFKSMAIARLRDSLPSVDDPMRLVISLTSDLPTVRYTAEIVGWDDKRLLPGTPRHSVLNRLITTLQPNEGGLYDQSHAEDGVSVNLLHIRRLRALRGLMEIALRIEDVLTAALDSEPATLEKIHRLMPALETCLKLARQVDRIAQVCQQARIPLENTLETHAAVRRLGVSSSPPSEDLQE